MKVTPSSSEKENQAFREVLSKVLSVSRPEMKKRIENAKKASSRVPAASSNS